MNRCPASLLVVVLVLSGCRERAHLPAPTPSSSALAGSVSPPAPSEVPPAGSVPSESEESPDTWLVVQQEGTELGLIELRAGKPLHLTLTSDGANGVALKRKLDELGGPRGLGLDMHLPPPSGEGRGPYGTVMVKPGERLYRHALKEALEPEYSVSEVQQLVDPLPPPNLERLTVSRSGKRVGTIDFTRTPPELTVHSDVPEASGMKSDLEFLQSRGELQVRYHHAVGGTSTLETAKAQPGDARYAQTAVLFLMVERSYRSRYAYQLEFSPAK